MYVYIYIYVCVCMYRRMCECMYIGLDNYVCNAT